MKINEKFEKIIQLIESGEHVFVTGKAGTGKSTLLSHFWKHTEKNVAVVAPTGVAAVNVGGQTIHSFFGLKPFTTYDKVRKTIPKKQKIIQKLDTLVIDEVSMVRADLFDMIDKSLRINRNSGLPFGGVQIVLFGDLLQLPPIVTSDEKETFTNVYKSPYFFSSLSSNEIRFHLVELTKVFRQKDPDFIDLLDKIRNGTIENSDLKKINSRFDPNYQFEADNFSIYLSSTNWIANSVNQDRLEKLHTEEFSYKAKISGKFSKSSFPSEENLNIKVGAQIMMLNNDQAARWVNGTIGKIVDVIPTAVSDYIIEKVEDGSFWDDDPEESESEDVLIVELEDGRKVEVKKHKWDLYEFALNPTSGKLEQQVVGSFEQYPLKLAWAVTIHKSQGKTFNKVVIDLGRGAFAPGQTYTALSRCTTLGGITLKKPIQSNSVIVDREILDFHKNLKLLE